MELLLRVEARVEQPRTADVLVRLEPDHTVGSLTAALATHVGLGHHPDLGLLPSGSGERLDPDAQVRDCALLSGEHVVLAREDVLPTPRQEPGRGVWLAVTSGPSAGYGRLLAPGRYTFGRNDKAGELHIRVEDQLVGADQLTLRVHPDLTVTVRERDNPTNKATLNGKESPQEFTLSTRDLLRIGATSVAVTPVQAAPAAPTDALGQVPFHRTPRRPQYPKQRSIPALGDVPTRPDAPRLSAAMILLPLAGGLVLAGVLGEPKFLIFILLAPLSALASYFESRKDRARRHEQALRRFTARLEARKQELQTALEAEHERRCAGAPDTADLRTRAERRSKELWDRARDHEDFLALRVGVGDVKPLITVEAERGGEDELRDAVHRANEVAATLPDVPVTVPVRELGVVALHGDPAAAANLAHALLVQAVCLHSPEDLVVTAAAGDALRLVEWLKWTPHTRAAGSPLAGPHLAQDKPSADALLRALLEVAEFRAGLHGQGVDRRWPWVLVALDRLLEPDPALVSQLLDLCPRVGIAVLWVSDTADRVPPQARAIVDCQPSAAGQLSQVWFTDPDSDPHILDLDGVHKGVPDQVGRALAPLRDASSASKAAAIPRVAPLLSTLGADAVTQSWLKEQWAKDRGYAVTTAIGMSADGPLELDLVEHGPHALIGGTSGAGKSELLQSLVAGLVAHHSPREVTLLFIDFKGGSASEVFKDLPHVVGRVTDLDEALALRAQTSIRAELRRRVGHFARLGVKDLAEMREKHPEQAPPSMVIVIDEFATLVKELPDFVAALVDIAQRGRSYGVHLILATQRPSAAVDDNILANTNLRISLRMLDRAESSSVIGTADAAEIPVPLKGRALARLGPGQLVEFQSAFSGAPLRTAAGPPPVQVLPFDDGSAVPGAAAAAGATGGPSELSALITAVLALNAPVARQIWNPLLPGDLSLCEVRSEGALTAAPRTAGRDVLLGKLDDPGAQAQYPATVNLESGGGLLVFGGAGSGKTSALRTLAVSAAQDDSDAGGFGLALFVLDFASGGLRDLQALPQCAAVATSADLEAATRVLAVLDQEITRRRADRETAQPPPRVLVLVDGYSGLVEALSGAPGSQEQISDQWLTTFHRIAVEGRPVGVHVAIAADRASSLRTSLLAAITTRIVLRQADDAEARELGAPSTRTMPPGGGYLGGLHVQIATVTDPLPELASGLTGAVPAALRTGRLGDRVAVASDVPLPHQGVLGLSDLTAEPVRFDLARSNLFVYGLPQSGRSTALLAVAHELLRAGHQVYAVGLEDSGLRCLDGQAATGWGKAGASAVLRDLAGKLEHPRSASRCVLVFDDLDLMDHAELYPLFDALLADPNLRIAGSAATITGFYSNQLMQELPKKSRQILFLQPASSREVAEFVGLARLPLLRLGLDMPPGRGLFVAKRRATVVQVTSASSEVAVPRQLAG